MALKIHRQGIRHTMSAERVLEARIPSLDPSQMRQGETLVILHKN